MPNREEAYVCKKCGYVLPKRDAIVSGWDSEGSLRHVHCPRCGKMITSLGVYFDTFCHAMPKSA